MKTGDGIVTKNKLPSYVHPDFNLPISMTALFLTMVVNCPLSLSFSVFAILARRSASEQPDIIKVGKDDNSSDR